MHKSEYPHIGETLYSATLGNGLRLFVIPKPGFSTNYAVFAADYGGAHRRFRLGSQLFDTPAGVAHFLEHKMFDLPGGDNALNILSQNGANPNAFTSAGVTCYYFQCTESFEENLRMLLHFVSTPYFTPETVSKEQGIIAQEIRMGEDNPAMVLYYDILSMLYRHHPIKDRVAGTVESIGEITDETLYACHKAFYAPSNMVLCVEGDVDPAFIERIALEKLPPELLPAPEADLWPEESPIPAQSLHIRQMEVSLPQFYIGARVEPRQDGEKLLRQSLVSRLAMRVLVGASSPFYTRLYADGLLNQDFGYELDFSAGTVTALIGGESGQPERVLAALKEEISRVSRDGLDEAGFLRAKKAALGSRLRALEDFDNVCVSTAMSAFDGYVAFDAAELLNDVSRRECEEFISGSLAPERLALAIIEPRKNQND